MPTLRRCTGTRVIDRSSRNISPASGCSSPAIIRNVVVLPHPLGPSSATMLPGSIVNDRRSTALVLPNSLVSSRSRTAAGAASTAKDLVVLFEELGAYGIDEAVIGAEDRHLVHLRLRVGHVFCDIRFELQTGDRRRGKGCFGEASLHIGVEHPVDEGEAEFGFGRVLDQSEAIDAGKSTLSREAHIDRRPLYRVWVVAFR